jgi:hypothetical protein
MYLGLYVEDFLDLWHIGVSDPNNRMLLCEDSTYSIAINHGWEQLAHFTHWSDARLLASECCRH